MTSPSFASSPSNAGSVIRILGNSLRSRLYFSRRSFFSFSLALMCFGTNSCSFTSIVGL